jgi:hypothetical protein
MASDDDVVDGAGFVTSNLDEPLVVRACAKSFEHFGATLRSDPFVSDGVFSRVGFDSFLVRVADCSRSRVEREPGSLQPIVIKDAERSVERVVTMLTRFDPRRGHE